MLARRLPSILPPLTRGEALEVTRIHSVAGLHCGAGLVAGGRSGRPTTRSPPRAWSAAAPCLVPGRRVWPTTACCSSTSCPSSPRPSLEALRQPLEDGRVAIVRGQLTCLFPTRFLLVAATNPCPCGVGESDPRCRCGEPDLARHRRRLSGPLLDRLDLLVAVGRVPADHLTREPRTDSAAARARVLEARERQLARLSGCGLTCNGQMDSRAVARHARLSDGARDALLDAYRHSTLTTRGHHRVTRVARTIADLDASDRVARSHMLKALGHRASEPDARVAA